MYDVSENRPAEIKLLHGNLLHDIHFIYSILIHTLFLITIVFTVRKMINHNAMRVFVYVVCQRQPFSFSLGNKYRHSTTNTVQALPQHHFRVRFLTL